MTALTVQALTREAFAKYGAAVSASFQQGGSVANQGTAVRYDWCAELCNARPGAKPNLTVFRCEAKSLPFEVKLLERHLHSTQVFIPMKVARYLVCVAPSLPDGAPDVTKLEAFLCRPGQCVTYAPGVWHHPMVALDEPAEFAMLVWEDGSAADCEVCALPTSRAIDR